MSVQLFKYDGYIYDQNSNLVLCENISSQEFYDKYWEKAIKELNIKILKDGSEFDISKLDIVLKELKLLQLWAKGNLQGINLDYMYDRIENLQKVISIAFDNANTILYIF